MKSEIKEIEDSINRIKKIRNLKAVYLFGSYATGKQHVNSDIDLCIIGNFSEKERQKILNCFYGNVDIVFFNSIPIWLKYRVFAEGKPLLINDNKMIFKLKLYTLKEYLDFKPFLNKFCMEKLGCMID